jgi:hypothetical protein
MDEAFMPFQQIIGRMLSFGGEIVDHEAGVHSYIYEYEIESPVELDIVRNDHGQLQIGSTPPLYYVDTSLRPSFHKLRFKANLSQVTDAD